MENLMFTFLVCLCVFSLFTITSAALGDTCTPTTVCTTSDKNSECDSNTKCVCKTDYVANGNGVCAKAIVGTVCTSDPTICSADDPNSECAGSPEKCACKDNYKANDGAICLKVNYCAPTPCKNGGTCANGANKFTCACTANWAGPTCERGSLGTCTSTSCPDAVSNGECVGTKCVCKANYTKNGTTCVLVDYCKSKPCKNSGTCTNGVNTFACTCAANWAGLTCEKVPDNAAVKTVIGATVSVTFGLMIALLLHI